MFEEIYFWTKNGRPDTEKDHDRNASCHYILHKMKTGGVIMKTYHVDPKDPIWDQGFHEKMDDTFFQKDLVPFVKYSINKKKRWETKGDLNSLKNLQKSHRFMDIVINDRVWLDSDPRWCFISHINYYHNYFLQFPIRHTYQLDTDNNYRCLSSDSVYGQPLKSLLPENRSPKKSDTLQSATFDMPKVAYHILTPPENYEKLRNEDFCPGSSDRFLKHRSIKHWRRCKKMTEALLAIRYEDFDYLNDPIYFIDNEWDIDFGTPSKFYNLEDHFVDDFVFVKRRRQKNDN
ncbi:hypothetical protein L3Y34_006790 [Caenorhabditis briggsae]|uniref:Uncharacterized protein n=2 Tax=Caenorhabditis briggsae TaxID=6238 RepID=A0AAE9A0N3_CAEBR|nr:hypothetical protein L3Y34_006790 [Caenorhabditis briggsae]